MARVFISHSSRDWEVSDRLKAWLDAQGYDRVFLDFDKHSGIGAGDDWESGLYRQVEACMAMVLVLTPAWMESKWCFAEFTQARALGKMVVPVVCASIEGGWRVARDVQHVDATANWDSAMARLGTALERVSGALQRGFPWSGLRPPYPGLDGFEAADAAVFFGRDAEVFRLVEQLNALRTYGARPVLLMIGASGSGKSSLLRAGVLPRLMRDTRGWVVIDPVRVGRDPFGALARAAAHSLGDGAERAVAHLAAGRAETAAPLIDRLLARRPAASVLLAVDQAEELFTQCDDATAERFLDLLASLGSSRAVVLLTLRSDFLSSFQAARPDWIAGSAQFLLRPVTAAAVEQIIEGPATVAGLSLEAGLVARIQADARTEDALPLLALMLRRLYDEHAQDGDITVAEYESLGNLNRGLNPLENVVRRLAEEAVALVGGAPQLEHVRRAFVGHLARINVSGEYVRRAAPRTVFSVEQWGVLGRLVNVRLLQVRTEGDEDVVEASHDALLRTWPQLTQWLDEARVEIIGRQQLELRVQQWLNAAEDDKAAEVLTGAALARASAWLRDDPESLMEEVRHFITSSEREAQRSQRARTRARAMAIVAGAALLVGLAIAVPVFLHQRGEAERLQLASEVAAQEAAVAEARAEAADARAEAEQLFRKARMRLKLAARDKLAEVDDVWLGHTFDHMAASAFVRGYVTRGDDVRVSSMSGVVVRGEVLKRSWGELPVLLTSGLTTYGDKGIPDDETWLVTFPLVGDAVDAIEIRPFWHLLDGKRSLAVAPLPRDLPAGVVPVSRVRVEGSALPPGEGRTLGILGLEAGRDWTLAVTQPTVQSDITDGNFHYRYATGFGFSGGPVFELQTGELLCLHEFGYRDLGAGSCYLISELLGESTDLPDLP